MTCRRLYVYTTFFAHFGRHTLFGPKELARDTKADASFRDSRKLELYNHSVVSHSSIIIKIGTRK